MIILRSTEDLQVGDLLINLENGKGTCKVLTKPVPSDNGRMAFRGCDERGREYMNMAQPTMVWEVMA